MPFESIVPSLLLKNLPDSASALQDFKTISGISFMLKWSNNVMCLCTFISVIQLTEVIVIGWKHVSYKASLAKKEGHHQKVAVDAKMCWMLSPERPHSRGGVASLQKCIPSFSDIRTQD